MESEGRIRYLLECEIDVKRIKKKRKKRTTRKNKQL